MITGSRLPITIYHYITIIPTISRIIHLQSFLYLLLLFFYFRYISIPPHAETVNVSPSEFTLAFTIHFETKTMGFYFFYFLQIFYFSFFHFSPPPLHSFRYPPPILIIFSHEKIITLVGQLPAIHHRCRARIEHIYTFGCDDCDNDVLYVRSSTTDILLPSLQIIHLGTFFNPPGKYIVSSTSAANTINASFSFFF